MSKGKVFITGITGTLGQAFTELLKDEYEVAGVDHNENAVAKFQADNPNIEVKVGDFVDADLSGYDTLIHLAALKHIDLCEKSPAACVYNNVVKSLDLFRQARKKNVKILFMSTDKAVEPTSVYGYSKALMENVALEFGGAFARSGNVMESNGSVMRVWDEAIKKDEPLKITHRGMRRFFITPENLTKRIWEQYVRGVRVIIPDMDMDILLLDLAKKKLREAGKNVETYPVKFIGLRPGEKLVESLRWGKEK